MIYIERRDQMNEQQYDKYLNINTAGIQYGFPKLIEYHRYEPTPYEGLDQLFEQFELPKTGRFVDVGCGKGRVPIYIHHRFQLPVVGIEMDQKFYIEAENNREQYLKKAKNRLAPIHFHLGKAESYQVDAQDTMFFFFNPFSVHILRKVMINIFHSIEQNPREIFIVLYYPSPQYMDYFLDELSVEIVYEVKLRNHKNYNERIVVLKCN